MLVDVKDTSNDSDVEIVELSGGASVEPQSGLRALDGTRETCQGEGRNSQRFEEIHQCNCGHKGPIASHLRTNQQCVQGIRDELSLGKCQTSPLSSSQHLFYKGAQLSVVKAGIMMRSPRFAYHGGRRVDGM